MIVGHVREIWRYPVKSMAGERLPRSQVGLRGLWGDRGWAVRNETTGEIHNAKRFPILMQCTATYRVPPGDEDVPDAEITFPDGTVIGTDSPTLAGRLSELMGRRVSLRRVEPATNRAYYRRRGAGAALIGRLAQSRHGRRILGWAMRRGAAGGAIREAFGRELGEPLPGVSDVPADVFEFYTPPGTYFDLFPVHVLTTGALQRMSRLNPGAAWDPRRFRPNVLVDTGEDAAGQVEATWVGREVRIGGFAVKGELPTVRCAMPAHAQPGLPGDPSVLRTIVREADQCLGLYASIVAAGRVVIGDPVDVG